MEKISAIRSDVSEKQIIVYTHACIESEITEQTETVYNINACHPRHVWDDDDKFFFIK